MDSLFTFLLEEDVNPTNNFAERMIRFAVLWRKRSQGTKSDNGNRWVEPRQTHDFFNEFGKILSPRDRAEVRWPICVMNSIKSVEKVAWLSIS